MLTAKTTSATSDRSDNTPGTLRMPSLTLAARRRRVKVQGIRFRAPSPCVGHLPEGTTTRGRTIWPAMLRGARSVEHYEATFSPPGTRVLWPVSTGYRHVQ